MMASAKSRPSSWISVQNHGENSNSSFSSCHNSTTLFKYCSYQKEVSKCYGVKRVRKVERKELAAVKGCKVGEGFCSVPEDGSRRLVEVLREVQPYINLHRGSTFVVILSAEIVDSPYLDALLQVLVNGLSSILGSESQPNEFIKFLAF